jgi:hypothetical protein
MDLPEPGLLIGGATITLVVFAAVIGTLTARIFASRNCSWHSGSE